MLAFLYEGRYRRVLEFACTPNGSVIALLDVDDSQVWVEVP